MHTVLLASRWSLAYAGKHFVRPRLEKCSSPVQSQSQCLHTIWPFLAIPSNSLSLPCNSRNLSQFRELNICTYEYVCRLWLSTNLACCGVCVCLCALEIFESLSLNTCHLTGETNLSCLQLQTAATAATVEREFKLVNYAYDLYAAAVLAWP